jgi:hypothetical protein
MMAGDVVEKMMTGPVFGYISTWMAGLGCKQFLEKCE